MIFYVWRPPHVFAVVRYGDCGRTVRVRWPEAWAPCRACGTPAEALTPTGNVAPLR